MKYLTDGVRLYEIAAQRTVQNFGLRRGTISYTILRDCVSEAMATVDDLHLAALSEVTLNPGLALSLREPRAAVRGRDGCVCLRGGDL